MVLIQPKINKDAELDSWSFETTNEINNLKARIDALLSAVEDLADSSTVDQLRDAIKDAIN